jgi:L-seryl-tRNA(Ser) seleniumtransferase
MSIYEELGLKTYINAWGTVTRMGGSLMNPAVIEAMRDASGAYIDLGDFHRKAGERIAYLIGVEDAFISCGAAAGIAIATAACIAGIDVVKINQLPDTEGIKNEVLVLKSHRSRYDQGIRMSGGKIVEVGYADIVLPEQLEAAINEKTAMFFYLAESEGLRGSLSLPLISKIMKQKGVPILVDAAAEIPPRENLKRFLEEGADLVVFSGGKDIRGPQSSGLVLGRRDLINACHANSCPNHSIGRSMKVDKETIAGLLKAVELYMSKDMKEDMFRMKCILHSLLESLKKHDDLFEAFEGIPAEPGIQPRICPRVYLKNRGNIPAQELKKQLENGDVPVICGIHDDMIVLNTQLLAETDVPIIIRQLIKATEI